jgi:hypothetical protein
MTCIELFVCELSTHLCTLNIIVFGVVFLYITINYWLGVVFNTTMCQHHAKMFISFKPETLFHWNIFNAIRSGFNSYWSHINILYRGIPLRIVCIGHFGLDFEFGGYIAVYHLYRCGIPLLLGSGINIPVGKKTLLAGHLSPTTPFTLNTLRMH